MRRYQVIIKKIEEIKAEVGNSSTSHVLCQSSILRSEVLSTLFSGKKWNRVSTIYHTMGWSHQETNQAMLHKETQGISKALQIKHTAALGLITLVSSRRKTKFPRTKNFTPSRQRSQMQTDLARSCSEQGHRARFLCPFIRASKTALTWTNSQEKVCFTLGFPLIAGDDM